MTDFTGVLSAAQQLSANDRLKLIDALWDSVPPDCEAPFSAEWATEIERRAAEVSAGKISTVPWAQIREQALAYIGELK